MTYAMMIASNARSIQGSVIFKKRTLVPRPAQRLIFIDDGLSSFDAYSTMYSEAKWWDQPITRHGDGNSLACANGRVECHKWKGIETIKQGRDNVRTRVGLSTPVTEEGNEDVQRGQRCIWESLAYDVFRTIVTEA